MSVDWILYEDRLNINGETRRERDVNNLKNNILNNIQDSPAFQAVQIDGISRNLVVISTDKPSIKQIHSLPNETYHTGQIVSFASGKWLITQSDFDNELYVDGEMTQCSLLLKWQNAAGTIIERYAVVEKPSGTLDENNIITTSNKNYQIKLPFDSETQNLFVNKRFLLEKANGTPLAYSLTSYDGVSSNYGQGGILNITLTQDEYNSSTDNASLMIADYFTPPVIPTGNAQILYTGNPTLLCGGSYKIFSPKFVDGSGDVLNLIPVWSWTSISSQTDKFTVGATTDGTFRIKALNFTSLIGSKIKIALTDSGGLYTTDLIVEVIDI